MERYILLTGASGDIGSAISENLAEPGAHLFLTGFHNPDRLCRLQEECTKKGASVFTFAGDFGKAETVASLFTEYKKHFPRLDVVINNAALSHVELFQDSSEENYQTILNANLSSAVRISKEAVRMMLPQKSGVILNISSVFGQIGGATEVEYSLTKGGLDAFTKALGKELALSGISVNALSLGAIDTKMNARLTPEERKDLENEIPIGRFGTPSEVAEMCRLLLSAPKYLTAAVIPFHGGWE